MAKYTVGIDLGTTNTVCCTFNNSFDFIKSKRGIMLPSVLMYKDGKITVGETAKQKALRNPENVISSSKTDMGNFEKVWNIEDKKFTPTDVAAEILNEVRIAAQKYFETNEQIEAVITVPAYFSASQSDETEKAAEIAGLKVLKILPEPVAAAIAYGLDEDIKSVFVVDIGGGTFDICLLEVSKDSDGKQKFVTKSIDGDGKLGGDDFDKIIENLCYSVLRKEVGIDMASFANSGLSLEEYGQARQKIRQKAEQAKIALSDAEETSIEIANLCTKNGTPINFSYLLTRVEFEKACSSLFTKIKRTITRCIDNDNIDVKSIGKVVFVGGTANIPYIKNIVNECLKQDAYADKDLSKLVAMGAALYASQTDTLVSTKLVIEDILSHSLGIEILGEKFSPIITKGTKYPTTKTEEYYTTIDYQKSVKISVYEGENIAYVKENTYYGGFELNNIRQGPAGVPIKVNFEINNNKQLVVTAWDETTGSKKSVTIKKGIKL